MLVLKVLKVLIAPGRLAEFVANHPGGQDKIMMAAGKSIDAYWNLYRQHLNNETASDLLKEMQIGVLDPNEPREEVDESNPYSKDPARHPGLKFHRFACDPKVYTEEHKHVDNETKHFFLLLCFVRCLHLFHQRSSTKSGRLALGRYTVYTLNVCVVVFTPPTPVFSLSLAHLSGWPSVSETEAFGSLCNAAHSRAMRSCLCP
jgi:hypothetical protein